MRKFARRRWPREVERVMIGPEVEARSSGRACGKGASGASPGAHIEGVQRGGRVSAEKAEPPPGLPFIRRPVLRSGARFL